MRAYVCVLFLILLQACYGVLVSDPEFSVVSINDADHQLILACDGIWKVGYYLTFAMCI